MKKRTVRNKSAEKKPTEKRASQTPAVLKAISKKQTRTEIIRHVSEETGLSPKQVRAVFMAVSALSKRHIMKRGSGEFAIPDMGVKIIRKTKPATKKRMGRNPKTGEAIVIAAKPKREVIRIRALKGLKEALL